MAEVILFHHAQGRTVGVLDIADHFRRAGHEVVVPDLYDGATFKRLEDGVSFAEDRGFDNLIATGVAAAEAHPPEVVYAGFSLGALVAHKLAQTRPGARGALLYHHGDVPVTMFGESWPDGVDLQLHVNEHDGWAVLDTLHEFIDVAQRSAETNLYLYPGSDHLFTDSSLPEYEGTSAALVVKRTLAFLDNHG
jgi:dienelactone hydrolase